MLLLSRASVPVYNSLRLIYYNVLCTYILYVRTISVKSHIMYRPIAQIIIIHPRGQTRIRVSGIFHPLDSCIQQYTSNDNSSLIGPRK